MLAFSFAVLMASAYVSEDNRRVGLQPSNQGQIKSSDKARDLNAEMSLREEFILWWLPQAMDCRQAIRAYAKDWMIHPAVTSFEKVFWKHPQDKHVEVLCSPLLSFNPKWTNDGCVEINVLTVFISRNRQSGEVFGFDFDTLTFEVRKEDRGLRIQKFSMLSSPKERRFCKFFEHDYAINRHIFKSKGANDIEAVRLWCLSSIEEDHKLSVQLLNRALRLNPTFALAYARRAEMYALAGERPASLSDSTRSRGLNTDDSEVLCICGWASECLGDLQQAIAHYGAAIDLEPSRYFRAFVDRGRLLAVLGELDLAMADFDRAIALEPESAYGHFYRGRANESLCNVSAAMCDYTNAIRCDKNLVSAYERRKALRLQMGDIRGGLADATSIVFLLPNDSHSYEERGRIREKLGDIEGAIRDFSEAIRSNPGNVILYSDRGVLLRKMGNFKAALSDADMMVQLTSNQLWPYLFRGLVRYQMKNFQGALRDLDICLQTQPDCGSAHRLRGDSLVALGRVEEGIESYDKAIQLAPNGSVFKARAEALVSVKRHTDALADLDQAIRLSPGNPCTLRDRGMIRIMLGDLGGIFDTAHAFKDAISLDLAR